MNNIIHLPGNIDTSQVIYSDDLLSEKIESIDENLQDINEYLDESNEVIGDSNADLDARVNNVKDYLDNSLYDTFVNTTLTEAQALANGEEDTVYYTSDTHSIVLNGNVYSSTGSSVVSPFKYANDTSDQANWDTNKIYLVKTAIDGQFTMYYYNGSAWTSAGTQTLSTLTAANVTYDLTNVNVGSGNVQTAIEGVYSNIDTKTNDILIEFIRERFPYDTGDNLYGYNIVDNVYNDLGTMHVESYPSANSTNKYETVYTINKVSKGTLIHYHTEHTSNYVLRISYSVSSPHEYYTTNSSSLLNFEIDGGIILNQTTDTKQMYDDYYLMPEDGYIMYSYYISVNGQNGLIKANSYFNYYDPQIMTNLYTEYYQKGIAKGAGMASIAGLGYNIFEYATFTKVNPVNLTGFKYGVDYAKKYPSINLSLNVFKGNTNWYYFPNIVLGGTNATCAFQNCTNLTTVYNLNIPTVLSVAGMFNGCTKLQRVGDINATAVTSGNNAAFRGTFSECTALKRVGKITNTICPNWYSTFYNCTALQRIDEIDFSSMCYPVRDGGNHYGLYYTFYKCTALRYLLIKNIGKLATGFDRYEYDFTQCTNWGVANTTHPDARNSVIDTLITYSFDRAGANLSAHKTSLSSMDITKILSGATVTINGNTIDITISDNGNVYNINDSEPLHTYINNITYYYYDSDNSTWTSTTISDETSIYYNNDDGKFYNADLTNNIMVEYVDSEWTNPYPGMTIKLAANTKALLTQEEKDQITAKGYTIA